MDNEYESTIERGSSVMTHNDRFSLGWYALAIPIVFLLLVVPLVWRKYRWKYLLSICVAGMVSVAFLWVRNVAAQDYVTPQLIYDLPTMNRGIEFSANSQCGGFSLCVTHYILDSPLMRPKGPGMRPPNGLEFYWYRKIEIPPTDRKNAGFNQPRLVDRWGFQIVWNMQPVLPGKLTSRDIGIAFPNWFAIALLLGMAWIFRRMDRRTSVRRRVATGRCGTCAYDLRAHKPGDKCPECGTPIPTANATSAPAGRG